MYCLVEAVNSYGQYHMIAHEEEIAFLFYRKNWMNNPEMASRSSIAIERF